MSDINIGENTDGPVPSVRPVRRVSRRSEAARPLWSLPTAANPTLSIPIEERSVTPSVIAIRDGKKRYYCPLCGLDLDYTYREEFMLYERARLMDNHLSGCVIFEVLKKHLSEKT